MIVAFSALPAWAQNGGVSSSEIANAAAASSAGVDGPLPNASPLITGPGVNPNTSPLHTFGEHEARIGAP